VLLLCYTVLNPRSMYLVSSHSLWLILGQNGSAVVLNIGELSADAKAAMEGGWNKYGHNEYVNRMIPLRRMLPDVRDPP